MLEINMSRPGPRAIRLSHTINVVFPRTEVQLRIAHIVYNSVKCVPYRDRREVCLTPCVDAAGAAL